MQINKKILTSYTGNGEIITVPEGIKEIAACAFCKCDTIKEIIFPKSLRIIGEEAFKGCTNLQKIVFAKGLHTIGDSAFCGCISLQTLCTADAIHHLPDTLKYIGEKAFAECVGLYQVLIPDLTQRLGSMAFEGCRGLTEVRLPAGLRILEAEVFKGCISLRHVYLPGNLTAIGESAFSDCRLLTKLRLPDTVTAIGDSAFSRCHSLSVLNAPDSLQVLGKNVFALCYGLGEDKTERFQEKLSGRQKAETEDGFILRQELKMREFSFCYRWEYKLAHVENRYWLDGAWRDRAVFCKNKEAVYGKDIVKIRDLRGNPTIHFYCSIPAFDYADRVWSSNASLYVIESGGFLTGIYFYGGYYLSDAVVYDGLYCADAKTEAFFKAMGMPKGRGSHCIVTESQATCTNFDRARLKAELDPRTPLKRSLFQKADDWIEFLMFDAFYQKPFIKFILAALFLWLFTKIR